MTVTQTGTYYWTVQYSGDQYNNGFTTACGDEITQLDAKDFGRDTITPPPADAEYALNAVARFSDSEAGPQPCSGWEFSGWHCSPGT